MDYISVSLREIRYHQLPAHSWLFYGGLNSQIEKMEARKGISLKWLPHTYFLYRKERVKENWNENRERKDWRCCLERKWMKKWMKGIWCVIVLHINERRIEQEMMNERWSYHRSKSRRKKPKTSEDPWFFLKRSYESKLYCSPMGFRKGKEERRKRRSSGMNWLNEWNSWKKWWENDAKMIEKDGLVTAPHPLVEPPTLLFQVLFFFEQKRLIVQITYYTSVDKWVTWTGRPDGTRMLVWLSTLSFSMARQCSRRWRASVLLSYVSNIGQSLFEKARPEYVGYSWLVVRPGHDHFSPDQHLFCICCLARTQDATEGLEPLLPTHRRSTPGHCIHCWSHRRVGCLRSGIGQTSPYTTRESPVHEGRLRGHHVCHRSGVVPRNIHLDASGGVDLRHQRIDHAAFRVKG